MTLLALFVDCYETRQDNKSIPLIHECQGSLRPLKCLKWFFGIWLFWTAHNNPIKEKSLYMFPMHKYAYLHLYTSQTMCIDVILQSVSLTSWYYFWKANWFVCLLAGTQSLLMGTVWRNCAKLLVRQNTSQLQLLPRPSKAKE